MAPPNPPFLLSWQIEFYFILIQKCGNGFVGEVTITALIELALKIIFNYFYNHGWILKNRGVFVGCVCTEENVPPKFGADRSQLIDNSNAFCKT